jgi:hypothetical protein
MGQKNQLIGVYGLHQGMILWGHHHRKNLLPDACLSPAFPDFASWVLSLSVVEASSQRVAAAYFP